MVALLIMGSAISLLSCKSSISSAVYNPETLVTMRSDTLTMSESENGRLKYRMETPLMERYELAREPYSEYRKGIYFENYKDSSAVVQSTVRADYAIYYEKRDEWMATGNVVATGEDGRTLYTEQLFYNVKTGRVYSNVESRVLQGNDIFIGEGFESDDKFEEWVFRDYTGRVAVNMEEDGKETSNEANGGNDPAAQENTQVGTDDASRNPVPEAAGQTPATFTPRVIDPPSTMELQKFSDENGIKKDGL